MKRIVLLILLFICQISIAQVISGFVYDAETDEPLVGVSVYFDGTTLATTTDNKGAFSIKAQEGLNKSLIFSYIGYEKVVLENPLAYTSKLKVLMKQDAEVLEEVVVKGKTIFTRKEMLRAFRKQFLGDNKGGRSCKIENEDDIYLYFDSRTNVLHAEAKKPVRITNKHLQYDVSFELADFQVAYYSTSLDENELASTFYAGTTFFKDVSKNGSADKKRRQAYRGSVAHLMHTFYNNDWQKQEFDWYVDKIRIEPDSCFTTTDSLGYKKITVKDLAPKEMPGLVTMQGANGTPRTLKRDFTRTQYVIMYRKSAQSVVNFTMRDFYVNEYGLFFPINALLFGGYLGDLRAGDLLPDDYQYVESD
jgi:CarboxypepD_reg-like domain